MKKIISELIDQPFNHSEVESRLKHLDDNLEVAKTWRNYHLIGDVIRGDVTAAHGCIVEKIDQKLLHEQKYSIAEGDLSSIQHTPSGDPWKSAGLFAVAASLVLFAVLAFNPQTPNRDTDSQLASITASQPNPLATLPTADQSPMARFEDEFGQMLVEHGEFSAASGLNGLVSYAKLVSNESLQQ